MAKAKAAKGPLKSWRICTALSVDRQKLAKLFQKTGVTALDPQTVTRREVRNGLMCYADPEFCFVSYGPANLPELLEGNPLVHAVTESPKVYCA